MPTSLFNPAGCGRFDPANMDATKNPLSLKGNPPLDVTKAVWHLAPNCSRCESFVPGSATVVGSDNGQGSFS